MEYNVALIGYPISHSKSKLLFEDMLSRSNLTGRYDLIEATEDNIDEVVKNILDSDYIGFNVTMPLKKIMASKCDVLVDRAYATNTVNVVKIEDGSLVGCNTDGLGLVSSLRLEGIDVSKSRFVVFGSGGASRSIVYELKYCNALEVNIVNRNDDESKILDWINQADIIINTTPVGMLVDGEIINSRYGNDIILPPSAKLSPSQTIVDIVYNPLETKLLELGKESGCKTINGLSMLEEQAKYGFEIYTGVRLYD